MGFVSFIKELSAIIPDDRLVKSGDELRPYLQDRSPVRLEADLDFVVVIIHSQSEVGVVLSLAYQHDVPSVVRGAGTGTTGGALPVKGCVVLSLMRLNRIIEIDEVNRVALVEPGVITGHLQQKVSEQGLFYPPDPASLETCTIGGNVAENAGGPQCMKYGVTGDYVLGLKGFYADGTPFSFGGKIRKNVAGYDVINLLVGSEGTLAVITEIVLRLIPKPIEGPMVHLGFSGYESALLFLQAVLTRQISPAIVEFLDGFCLQKVIELHLFSIEKVDLPAHVMIGLDGNCESAISKEVETICQLGDSFGAECVWVADTASKKRQLIEARRMVSPSLTHFFPFKQSHDVVVPVSCIPRYMGMLRDLSIETGVLVVGYGHLGDGNIHVNILLDTELNASQFGPPLSQKILAYAVELGGSITGEHGIGLTKKPYLSLMFSKEDLALFGRIKLAFDPKNLLNPHKLI